MERHQAYQVAFQEQMQARLDEWKAEIDKMRAKADKASADARMDYLRRVDELESKRDEVQQRIKSLKKQGGEAWEDVKNGLESAMSELKRSVDSAASRFDR